MSSEREKSRYGPLVGAIDQGTTSTRFMVFVADTFQLVTYHQVPVKTEHPKHGWQQQDPMELFNTVIICIEETCKKLEKLSIDPADIISIGITNQRETTVVWDKLTGQPLHPAILWSDIRSQSVLETIADRLSLTGSSRLFFLQEKCGLTFSCYFSAPKIRWLLDNVPGVQEACDDNRLLFGTIDTWLIWNLTRRQVDDDFASVHVTDVSNASRTMLMDIKELKWDPYLIELFKIPREILPDIRSSCEVYGKVNVGILAGTPISGCLGDQQAALLGQHCLVPGHTKVTYGTGCFLLTNIGTMPVTSQRGLVTTVAFKLGPSTAPVYALEGSIAHAGSGLEWLRTVGLLQTPQANGVPPEGAKSREEFGVKSSPSSENIYGEKSKLNVASSSDGVYIVPALGGYFAPRWKPLARATITGLSRFTKRENIVRAAVEALCFQVRELIECVESDSGIKLTSLLVDGGLSNNNILTQIQADALGLPVHRPSMLETTALGAAIAAARGIGLWQSCTTGENRNDGYLTVDTTRQDLTTTISTTIMDQINKNFSNQNPLGATADTFLPQTTEEDRNKNYFAWRKVVEISLTIPTSSSQAAQQSQAHHDELDPFADIFDMFGHDTEHSHLHQHYHSQPQTEAAILQSLPGTIFVFTSFAILIAAQHFGGKF